MTTHVDANILLFAEVLVVFLIGTVPIVAEKPRSVYASVAATTILVTLIPRQHGWAVGLLVAGSAIAMLLGSQVAALRPRKAEWTLCCLAAFCSALALIVLRLDLQVRTGLMPVPITEGRLACIYLALAAAVLGTIHTGMMVGSVLVREGIQPPDAANSNGSGVEHGWLIGYLERLLAITLVACGSFEGLGFLAAAKGLVRSQDLKVREMAEYFLIGTLLSILAATGIGLALRAAFTALW